MDYERIAFGLYAATDLVRAFLRLAQCGQAGTPSSIDDLILLTFRFYFTH